MTWELVGGPKESAWYNNPQYGFWEPNLDPLQEVWNLPWWAGEMAQWLRALLLFQRS